MLASAFNVSTDYHNIACSGAGIWSLTQAWSAKGQPSQVSQLQTYDPSLVTVTIGGNSLIEGTSPSNPDWGFSNILTDCYLFGNASIALTQENLAGCSADGTLSEAEDAISSLDPTSGLIARLTGAYRAITTAAPKAKVLVVGYPDIFPSKWSHSTELHCPWLGPNDILGLNNVATDLNESVQAAAKDAGVDFVSTLNVMQGHTLCTANSYIQSISVATGILTSSAGHPIEPGQQALEKPIANAIRHMTVPLPPAPTIRYFNANPLIPSSGGNVGLYGSVANATSCTISSNKSLPGFPVVLPCSNGYFNTYAALPSNLSKRNVTYKFTLKVTGSQKPATQQDSVVVLFATTLTGVRAGPAALAFDGTNMWVANSFGNSVTEFNGATGSTLQTWSDPSYGFNDPSSIVYDGQDIWVVNAYGSSPTLTEMNASNGALLRVIPFPGPTSLQIASDGTNLWVADSGGGSITELDHNGNIVRILSDPSYGFDSPLSIGYEGGNMWVGNENDTVSEFSPTDGSLIRVLPISIDLNGSSYGIVANTLAFDGTHVWVVDNEGGAIEIDPTDGTTATIAGVAPWSEGIVFDGSHMWITGWASDGAPTTVTEVDSLTGAALENISAPADGFGIGTAYGVAFDGSHIWIASPNQGSITEINANDGSLFRVLS